jgi:chromosome segregation protein
VRLKSLRLFGFKTFADPTTVIFEPGITALVGPNGSGKSNIVDAIRWALGEHSPKSLRSTKTEDVIFAGNERRKPLGMVEVSLTFDNEDGALALDYGEVQITRRAYRAGESEFYINRSQVRLRDIVELLMGTGLGPGSYAIVSQGQIDAVLSEKPTERRGLFEEAAGISKFLARKAETLRRLEHTEQNGVRISDLLSEISARIPELETQARRARRHRRASARLRDLEILTYLRSTASRREERSRVRADFDRLDAEHAAAAARAATVDAELATLRTRLYGAELLLEERRGAATAARAELSEREAKGAAVQARHEALASQSATTADDGERAAAERAALEASLAQLEERVAPYSATFEELRDREGAAHDALASARVDLERVFTELRELEATAAAGAASEADRRAQVRALCADIERLEGEIAALSGEATSREETVAVHAREAADVDAAIASLEARVTANGERSGAAEARVGEAAERHADAQSLYRGATSELAGAEARLHTIEELEANLEGHVPGTRAVLEADARKELRGILGVVANLIHVEEKYARALDIAFGASLSNIVTQTSDDAERAIAYLSKRELGRATFLPLELLGSRAGRDAASMPRAPGVIGYAHSLVRVSPEYAGIVAFLVGRTLVVDSLIVGIRLVRASKDGAFRDSIVTLDGDQISGGGAMTGGRYRRERAILSRRAQAEGLRKEIPSLREALARAEADVQVRAGENAAAIAEFDDARRLASDSALHLHDARARAAALLSERERVAGEARSARERESARRVEAAQARERLAALGRPPSDTSDVDARRRALDVALSAARERIALAEDRERGIASRLSAAREEFAGVVAQRDAERARLAMLEGDRTRGAAASEQMTAEIARLAERLRESEQALLQAREAVAASDAQAEAARAEREAMNARSSALESDLRLAQNAERASATANEGARVRLAEIDAELGVLTATFAQHPATAEECADVEARYAKERDDFTAEIARLREELVRLANVNLNAEKDREELATRETFLREQLEDLMKARETLLASIREIEQSSQARFNETFAEVRRAFEATFPRLFPGGEAKMWQTNPESLADTGIEIAVQPPGKKMTALAALSGGERAMTSAALIFALIAVRPSPFYLLDEVDAALDDANVERFSAMVRDVASGAQMVLVTHNRKTMELADRLYGVTMAEPGVSSVVAADLTRVEEREEALAG